MSPGTNGNNPSIFSDFKLPEKRKTIEDMSLQDWIQKVHRLKSHNSKLEADLDKIQVQYEQTYQQKENILKKAKELTEAVNGIFLKYDELEGTVKWKEDEIELLQLRIGRLETDLTIARNSARKQQEHQQRSQESFGSRSPVRQQSNFPTEHYQHPPPHSPIDQSLPNSMSTTRPYSFSNASITQEEKILDLSQLLFEAQEREKSTIEENSRLKSRILELEGIVSGTSYYQAVKNTPSRPSSQRMNVGNEGDQQNHNNGNSSNNSSSHNSSSRSEIQKLVSALQTAALPSSSSSNQNTPARSRLSSSSQLTTPIGLSSSHNKSSNNSHHHFTYLESLLSPVKPNNGHTNGNDISLRNNNNNLLSTGRTDQLLEERGEEEEQEQEQSERLIFQKNSTDPNQEDGNGK
jgi:hypothetical protein